MTAPIRLAILGAGLIGKRHLATAAEESACNVVAAADTSESARQQVEARDTRWRVSRAAGGGPALINLIHDIDLMRHLAGDIVRVYAELGYGARGFDVEDTIAAIIRSGENGQAVRPESVDVRDSLT